MSKLTQHLASEIVLERDLAPKSENAHGARSARMRAVLGGNTAKMFTLNILTVLFALPMICVLIIWLPIEESPPAPCPSGIGCSSLSPQASSKPRHLPRHGLTAGGVTPGIA